jgi:hypothetical protein
MEVLAACRRVEGMASLNAEVSITRLATLGLIKFCCLRADVMFTVELTVPAIANTSAIASVITNTSAITSVISNTSASVTISGSDGLKSDCAMGNVLANRVIIFFLEGCVSQLAISLAVR